MDKVELNFLADSKYATDTTYINHYLNPTNKESLKKLTKAKMMDDVKITQVGLFENFHTFEIIALNGEGNLCENCVVYINDKETSIDLLPHGSIAKWKVKFNGHMSNEIEDPVNKDTILIITVSGDEKVDIVRNEDINIDDLFDKIYN